MDGILRCSKYAFGPNRLHYCGPDKNKEILSYIEEGETDQGLVGLLSQFETMYPYLRHIADANKIQDPLDDRVVEAYWLGNSLLDTIPKQKFYRHLEENLRLKDKFGMHGFGFVAEKIGRGALPFHAFHVFDVWKRNGNDRHTVGNMDACRISFGKIISVNGPFLTVETEPLVLQNGKLALGPTLQKKLIRELESDYDIEQLQPGDMVSMHWNVVCEKLTQRQVENLRKYTLMHMAIANETI